MDALIWSSAREIRPRASFPEVSFIIYQDMIEVIDVALCVVFHLFCLPGCYSHPEKSVAGCTDEQMPIVLLCDIIDTR